MLPLVMLYFAVDYYYPSLPTAERAAEQAVMQLDEDDFDRGDACLRAPSERFVLIGTNCIKWRCLCSEHVSFLLFLQ